MDCFFSQEFDIKTEKYMSTKWNILRWNQRNSAVNQGNIIGELIRNKIVIAAILQLAVFGIK